MPVKMLGTHRKAGAGALALVLLGSLIGAPPALGQSPSDEIKLADEPWFIDQQIAAQKIANGEPLPNGPAEGPPPPPVNDDCVDATPIAVPGSATGNTSLASNDPVVAGTTCGTSVTDPSQGVWHTVIGTGNTMTATTCQPGSDYDTKLTIYCEECAAPTCVGGNDDQPGAADPACDTTGIGLNRGSTVSWCSEPGAEYLVFVHGFGAAAGNYEVAVSDDGVPCGGAVACLPVGACCQGVACSQETEAACMALGGDYQGDGTPCFTPDGAPTVIASAPAVAIPDNDPGGVSDTITVASSFTVAVVTVDLDITHTFIGDLIISLEHVNSGTTVVLWDRACSFENNLSVTFDDAAPDIVCAEPTVGALNPVSADGGLLNAFAGLDAASDWVLTVSDNAGLDLGTLDSWSLSVDSGVAVCDPGGGGGFDVNVPTLDKVGLAVLISLLALGAVFLLRRRA